MRICRTKIDFCREFPAPTPHPNSSTTRAAGREAKDKRQSKMRLTKFEWFYSKEMIKKKKEMEEEKKREKRKKKIKCWTD